MYIHIIGILKGTNCAPLIADLFLFCYERDFMNSAPDDNQSNRKAMNRNWCNQKANPALKTKTGNK